MGIYVMVLRGLAWLVFLVLLPLAVTGQNEREWPAGGASLVDQQGRIWEAAKRGLWLREGTRKTQFTTQNGLSNDTITALAQDASGQVWVGTREGLLAYDGAGFREITYAQGLPSKQITALYASPSGDFWVGTRAGAVRYVGRQLVPLPALQGTAVQFIGEDAHNWVFVTNTGIRRLPKEQPISWQWLGWSAGGLLLVGGGLWSGWQWRRGQQVRLRLAQTEQRALLAQMNPHFIFNSLQSIQNYILRHQAEAAQHYLTRFGGLMRLILEQSRHPLLPLRDELSMLCSYLELESLRFEQQFTYAVAADDALLDEEIPVMLLHPLVENAVWHGLAHHAGRGHIDVRVTREGDYLVAMVQDNGVGRLRAAGRAGNHTGYPSRGSAIMEERIALLNRQARRPISVVITDLGSADSPPQGTRVVVRIPRLHS
ncbi:sensor histidine kinase [Hymenobacter arizonensis]|uniref:Two component regulator propeller n=1 Tax=Hymenobacter arizonensis TaxID=1227077 RepID=A0A1I6BR82_HYMAR|nr:histidine kinase [Hymenobacter arizonensis]SFQ83374.1 Two component regulator propeller [Hymenobacter arizonensis]